MGENNAIQEKYEFSGLPSLRRPDLVPPTGWSLPYLTSIQTIRNHTLSPDGCRIAFFWDRDGTSDLYTLALQGGWAKRLSVDRGPVIPWDDELPRWSADSHWLAFTQAEHVYVVSASGGLPEKITDFAQSASSPVWLPAGDGLIVSIDRYDFTQLALTDRQGSLPVPLTNHRNGGAGDAQPSPDGRFVAYVFRPLEDLTRSDLRLITLENSSSGTLYGKPGVYAHTPRWHPHGAQVAFLSQESGFYEIWLVNLGSYPPIQLTRVGCDILDFTWSPDGSKIACIVNRNGALEMDFIDPDDGSSETILAGKGCFTRLNWSVDGKFIILEYENPFQPADLFRYELDTRSLTQLTFSQLPAIANLNLVAPEPVQYSSQDNLVISGFLYRPEKSNGAGIVYLHGGPNDQYMYTWDVFAQYLTAKGYTLLAPNYRGSTGYGVNFERMNYLDWGGGDLHDCLQAANFLASNNGVDPGRIASWGPSYGGYLTNCALTFDPKYRFACGISVFGDANLLSSWALCSRRLRLYTEAYLGNPADHPDLYASRSPVHQVNRVRKPFLLLHGLQDDIVPPQASEEWATALKRAGKNYEYKTYAEEPHGFLRRSNRLDAWERIERFLDWYLLPGGNHLR